MGKGIGGHHSVKGQTEEWLTPPHIIKSLGPFDLDPCSPVVRPWDTATKHLSKEDDENIQICGIIYLTTAILQGRLKQHLEKNYENSDIE